MTDLTQDLLKLLELKQIDTLIFQGISTKIFGKHLFGGQLLAQALVAAAKTTNRPAHSLHANFIRSGVTESPVLYRIECLQDGTSFSRRQVHALQNGQIIFSALISFVNHEVGVEYQLMPPEYPNPETLTSEQIHKDRLRNRILPEHANFFNEDFQINIHPIEFIDPYKPKRNTKYAEYFKTYDLIPKHLDSYILHQAIAAYYSDYNLLSVSLLTHGLSFASENIISASLDHAIYFHRPFRVDQWSLYDLRTTVTAQARGLNFGKIWQNGNLVCTTVQESLMRQY